MIKMPRDIVLHLALAMLLAAGCAIHPRGESEERERAEQAGKPFVKVFDERELPPLAPDAPWPEVLRHAFLASAELEQRYWEWRAALEEIPQEASPKTTAAFFFNYLFSGGSASFWDRATVAVGNDPMFNLPLPGKLATRGRIALEKARAAGLRFERAKFELQEKVLKACFEWALLGELIRVQEANLALLEVVAQSAEARTLAAAALQQDLLKARTERDLARNRLEILRSQVPAQEARLNALLSRSDGAAMSLPPALPPPRKLVYSDEELVRLMRERNPELGAIEKDLAGRKEAIRLAWLEFIPEFGVTATGNLGGDSQMLAGMVTLPILRYEAIRGGIRQARAELRAAQALERQVRNDFQARVVAGLHALRNADRQALLFEGTILPRAREIVAATRISYSSGQVPLVELLDSQRMLLEAMNTLGELRMEREKLLAEIEALAAVDVESR